MESFELIDNLFQIVVLLCCRRMPQVFWLCGTGAAAF